MQKCTTLTLCKTFAKKNWFYGYYKGKTGLFPADYVEMEVPQDQLETVGEREKFIRSTTDSPMVKERVQRLPPRPLVFSSAQRSYSPPKPKKTGFRAFVKRALS